MNQKMKARIVAQSSQSKSEKAGGANKGETVQKEATSSLADKLDKAQGKSVTAQPATTGAHSTASSPPTASNSSPSRSEQHDPQPARSHIAANDDLPSIGGLIYALQQRPSRSPFLFALAASFIWLILGGGAGWALLKASVPEVTGFGSMIQHPSALVVVATIIVPIALFWFLALLIWRAQELRLMASAMTEVAIRLAEPDKLAEQSVASLGQTIRRQVAAMNDAISRALGRAGELEALVHNEVATLENSYGENELRIRRLIDELSSEREALANNSERVSDALRGVGSQVSKEITSAGNQATKSLIVATSSIAEALTAKSGKITAAMTAAGTAIDNKIAERGIRVAEAMQETSRKAGEAMDVKANSLFQSMANVSNRLSKEVPDLLERLDGEQQRLDGIIVSASKNFGTLETAIKQRTTELDTTIRKRGQELTTSLSQGAVQMDLTLQKKTEELKASLAERIQALDSTVSSQAKALEHSLSKNMAVMNQNTATMQQTLTQSTSSMKQLLNQNTSAMKDTLNQNASTMKQTLNQSTMAMNQVLAEGADSVKRSSAQMKDDSHKATGDLSAQAQTLKDVSTGMLNQIHSLTQRFEKQGQAIMTASQALDSSNSRIDSILERRHLEISGLLETVSTKAQSLDKMMRSYTGIIESSLVQVETRAKELSITLVQESSSQSRATIEEIERLRIDTHVHTQQAVQELQSNFQSITNQVGEQLSVLTQQFGKTASEMRGTASQTAGEIENTRLELRRRMRELPQETRQNTEAMRKAVSDQLKALGALSAIASKHRNTDAITPPPASPMPALSSPLPPVPAAGQPPSSSYTAQAGENTRATGMQLPARPLPATAMQAPAPAHQLAATRAQLQQPARGNNDMASVTSGLASQLSSAGQRQTPAPAAQPHNQQGVRITGGPPPAVSPSGWSVGDLLARASQGDNTGTYPPATTAQQPQNTPPASTVAPAPVAPAPVAPAPVAPAPVAPASGAADLRLTDLARAIDQRTASEIWQRFQRGEHDVFSRHLYTHEGQTAFDEISARYQRDTEFRGTVDRYIGDFERLLSEAENKQQDPAIVQNYLTSETGRVYLMLAHASGRLS